MQIKTTLAVYEKNEVASPSEATSFGFIDLILSFNNAACHNTF